MAPTGHTQQASKPWVPKFSYCFERQWDAPDTIPRDTIQRLQFTSFTSPTNHRPPQRLYSGWVCLSLCQVKTKPVVTHALHFFRHAKPEHTWKPQMCNTAANSVPFFIHEHVRNLLVNTQRKFICDEHDLNTCIWKQCKSADYCKWTESS